MNFSFALTRNLHVAVIYTILFLINIALYIFEKVRTRLADQVAFLNKMQLSHH